MGHNRSAEDRMVKLKRTRKQARQEESHPEPLAKPSNDAGQNAWKRYYWKRNREQYKQNRDLLIAAEKKHRETRRLLKPTMPTKPEKMEQYLYDLEKWKRKMTERGHVV